MFLTENISPQEIRYLAQTAVRNIAVSSPKWNTSDQEMVVPATAVRSTQTPWFHDPYILVISQERDFSTYPITNKNGLLKQLLQELICQLRKNAILSIPNLLQSFDAVACHWGLEWNCINLQYQPKNTKTEGFL